MCPEDPLRDRFGGDAEVAVEVLVGSARAEAAHADEDSVGTNEGVPAEPDRGLHGDPDRRIADDACTDMGRLSQEQVERGHRYNAYGEALFTQNFLRREAADGNRSAAGAYELSPANGKARATIFASGSEVEIALAAQKILGEQSFAVRVVSVPSLDLFLAQPPHVRASVIGDAPVRIAVEAAVRFGWDALIGSDGIFVGMSGFGASAPYKDLYRHFGITAEAVAERILRTHNL